MISYTAIQAIERFLAPTSSTTYLMTVLAQLTQDSIGVEKGLTEVLGASDPSNAWILRTAAAKLASAALDHCREIDPFQLGSDLDRLEQSIISFSDAFETKDPQLVEKFLFYVGGFRDAYRAVSKSHNIIPATRMINSARELYSAVQSSRGVLHLLKLNLDSVPGVDGLTGERLTILFESYFDLIEIAQKLSSLNRIYQELGAILGVSNDEDALQLIKIESGSLLVDVLGRTEVISMLSALVISIGAFVYRNKTREGRRRDFVSSRVESIRVQHWLADELRIRGLSSPKVEAELVASSEILAEQLTVFVDTGNMSVNGTRVQPHVLISQLPPSVPPRPALPALPPSPPPEAE